MALTKITSRILDSSGVTTVGTISTGVWQGTAINQTYLVGQSGTNTGDETLARINALDITELGTISSGVWNGTVIASAYLDADTAHLSTTQTFTGAKTFSSAATFSGSVGIGSTGIFAGTNAILNLQGIGIALKNDKNGSNNNWSYIQNTGTGSNSDINFYTGNNSSALNLSHSGDATFGGSVSVNGIGTTPSLRLNNTTSTTGKDWHLYSLNNGTFGLYDNTNSAYRFNISPDGKVGIGTTSPSAKLTIDLGDSSSAPTTFTTSNSYLQLGTTSYNTAGAVYSIGFGYTGGSTNSPAYIGLKQTGTGNATKGDLVFLTRDSTNDIAPTERLRISSNGKVGIGTTTMHQDLNLISSSTSQSLINIGTSNSSRFLNVGVSGSAGYIMMENAAALNIGTGGVTRLSISSTGAATFNSSLAGFGAIITNNNDSSEGLLVRTSDNDGTQYILDLQSSSSATGTNYSSKFKVAKSGVSTFSGRANFNGNINVVSANAEIWIGESTSGGGAGFLKWNDAGNYLYLGNSYNSAFNTDLVISNVGNVGIGTDSPDYQLDIENSSHAILRLHAGTNSSASIRLKNDAIDWDVNTQTNDTFAIYSHTSNTQPFSILPNGNVGIGNTSPAQKLHILQPSYISPSTVQGLIRLTGQSYQENSGTTPSAGTSIEFYNKWNTGSEYSVARIAGRASQGYDGGLQFDVGSNSGPGGNGFTTAMSILADGKVTIQQGLTVGTDNTLAGSNYIKGDVYRPGAGNYVERIFDVSASSSGSSWIFARQFHDHVNWGNGNINVIIQGTYYSHDKFFKGDFSCRYGYGGGSATITTNFNGGVPAPTWQGAVNVGGNIHYRNLVFAAGAYTKYTIRIILTGTLVITSNSTANSANLVWIPNF